MKEKIYNIPEVEVRPYPNFSDFKYAFLHLELPKDSLEVELNLPEFETPKPFTIANFELKLVLDGPFTKLYDKYSVRGKDKFAHAELKIKTSKFNQEIVKRVTGLTDPDVILSFMFFCDISAAFITQATDYEIIEAINECYKEFTSHN